MNISRHSRVLSVVCLHSKQSFHILTYIHISSWVRRYAGYLRAYSGRSMPFALTNQGSTQAKPAIGLVREDKSWILKFEIYKFWAQDWGIAGFGHLLVSIRWWRVLFYSPPLLCDGKRVIWLTIYCRIVVIEENTYSIYLPITTSVFPMIGKILSRLLFRNN